MSTEKAKQVETRLMVAATTASALMEAKKADNGGSTSIVEYKPPVMLEDKEDLEIKLRRILENVLFTLATPLEVPLVLDPVISTRRISDVFWEAISSGNILSCLGTKNVQSFVSSFIYFYSYSYFTRLHSERIGSKSIGTKANLLIAAASAAFTNILTQLVWSFGFSQAIIVFIYLVKSRPFYSIMIYITCIIVAAGVLLLYFLFKFYCFLLRYPQLEPSGGLSSKFVQKLPKFKVSKPGTLHGSDCVVCLQRFKKGQWCRRLTGCGHVFHRKCVDTWFRKAATCPICRARVILQQGILRKLCFGFRRDNL